ncbi:MAG: YrbL family protein [Acidaminococcaceae bacterium]|nr:YrbL family protein [Acidaminococcaceae bacterium]MDO4936030.1 YrbL family protein [Phascolarctobacterium sp.]
MEKIVLDEKNLIGVGCHKKCYRHPLDSQKCVEIIYNKEGLKDISRELRYRHYMTEHPNFDYSMLPGYYGETETNLGKGYVYELIAQPDGSPCPTFRDYFQNTELLKKEEELLIKLMWQLKQDMLKNEIITMNITEENIAVQTTTNGKRIRLLSDLGSSFFLPTDYWFRNVRLNRIKRHWEKMCNKFIELFPSPEVKEFTEKIR